MSTTAADSIAGVVIPDTELVREITAFIRDAEDDLLFDHSRRVFLFGALQGRRRGLQPDLELLYAGAMFHDIGLTETYRTSMLRFEVDGANAARDFLLDHGVGEADARKVWLSIALHTTPNVPEFLAQLEAIDAPTFLISVPDAFQCRGGHFDYVAGTQTFVEVVHPDHNVWYTPYTFTNTIKKYSALTVEQMWFFNRISLLALLSKDRMRLAA